MKNYDKRDTKVNQRTKMRNGGEKRDKYRGIDRAASERGRAIRDFERRDLEPTDD